MSGLAFAGALAEGRSGPTRALRTAVELDPVDAESLVAAGIPRWEAIDLVRRMESAGELRSGRWTAEARERYRAALAPPAAAPEVRPARALDLLEDGERPREKALRGGIDGLDDHELIALLLRTGGSEGVLEFARRILAQHGGLAGLARHDVVELVQAEGLGPAKAAELAAAFELGRRLSSAALRARPSLTEPAAVAALLAPLMVSLPQEELWCLPLDRQSRLIGEPVQVSRGDVDGTDAGPRAFFRHALRLGSVSAIAAHNHPGGDPTPSEADRAVTRRLAAAGRTIDIALVDHLVIGAGGAYTSLRRTSPECFR